MLNKSINNYVVVYVLFLEQKCHFKRGFRHFKLLWGHAIWIRPKVPRRLSQKILKL